MPLPSLNDLRLLKGVIARRKRISLIEGGLPRGLDYIEDSAKRLRRARGARALFPDLLDKKQGKTFLYVNRRTGLPTPVTIDPNIKDLAALAESLVDPTKPHKRPSLRAIRTDKGRMAVAPDTLLHEEIMKAIEPHIEEGSRMAQTGYLGTDAKGIPERASWLNWLFDHSLEDNTNGP